MKNNDDDVCVCACTLLYCTALGGVTLHLDKFQPSQCRLHHLIDSTHLASVRQ